MAEQSWTDDPITAGASRIKKKAVHITELQSAINAWETAYGITNTSFTDSPAAEVQIKATAVSELQDALDALYQLTDGQDFTFTPASGNIKPAHINELRTDMNLMQNSKCYNCDSCDNHVESCTCDVSCNSDECDQCDATCYGYVACTCNNVCYGYSACGCNNVCYSAVDKGGCNICNFVCYGHGACSCNSTTYGAVACTCDSSCNSDSCDQCDSTCYTETDTCTKCHTSNYRYPWT